MQAAYSVRAGECTSKAIAAGDEEVELAEVDEAKAVSVLRLCVSVTVCAGGSCRACDGCD